MSERTHFVYRAYDAEGRLLYVGCTNSPERRYREHRTKSDWFTDAARFAMSGPYPQGAAMKQEAEAIRTSAPIHNKRKYVFSHSPVEFMTEEEKDFQQKYYAAHSGPGHRRDLYRHTLYLSMMVRGAPIDEEILDGELRPGGTKERPKAIRYWTARDWINARAEAFLPGSGEHRKFAEREEVIVEAMISAGALYVEDLFPTLRGGAA